MRTTWLLVLTLGLGSTAAFADDDHRRGRREDRYDNRRDHRDDRRDRDGDRFERRRSRGRVVVEHRVRPGWMPERHRDYARGRRPSARHVWIGSAWVPRGGIYVSIPGFWALRPHPRAVWVEGHWTWTRHGYVWVDGHWR